MPRIDVSRWDLPALAKAWRAAQPFPHVVVDGLLDPAALDELRGGFTREPHWPDRDEIYDFVATAKPPTQPELLAFAAELDGPLVRAAVGAISGKTVGRADARGYAYLAGHYLLPHSDHRAELGRLVAYAYYLSPEGAFEGGELELLRCTVVGGEIAATEPAVIIAPAPNRLVLFDVSHTSLHQVREVLRGARVSLAGWFYP